MVVVVVVAVVVCYKFATESNSERILKIGQYLVKLWARVRCLVFLTHGVVYFTSTCSQADRRIELVFGTKASFDLSYTVLYKNSGIYKTVLLSETLS